MGALEVLDGGFFTTIQDAGRTGYRKYGVPVSGALDEYALKMANWLVDNKADAPVLEITLTGGSFRFKSEAYLGITGANIQVEMNDKKCDLYKTIVAEAGDVLKVGKTESGCRVYLAIHGRWSFKKVMGSYSTNIQAKFGGLKGRALQKGDELHWNTSNQHIESKEVEPSLIPYFGSSYRIRIIRGPEWNLLNKEQQHSLLKSEFKILPESNRMGIRLMTKEAIKVDSGSMTSAPVMPGIIQLPPDGQPIILMNDAQSVGGYPRVAKVIDADLWRMGQIWPPARLRFQMISREKAIKLSAFQKKLLY